MEVLQSSERHDHPAFHVRILEDERLVPYDCLEVGVEELENEIDVLLDREDVEQLLSTLSLFLSWRDDRAHRDDVAMP